MSQSSSREECPGSPPLLLVHVVGEPAMLEHMQGCLAHLKVASSLSANPKKALKQISGGRTNQCQLVFCDNDLPEETCRKVGSLALRRDPNAFVILLAEPDSRESSDAAGQTGIYRRLPKPIDVSQLAEVLAEVADQFQRRLRIRELQATLAKELVIFFLKKHIRLSAEQEREQAAEPGQLEGRLEDLRRAAQSAFLRQFWPRTVENLEAFIANAAGDDLPEVGNLPVLTAAPDSLRCETNTDPLSMDEMRLEHIQRVLDHCGGNRVRAARLLGIGRTSLYRYLKREAGKLTAVHSASASARSLSPMENSQ